MEPEPSFEITRTAAPLRRQVLDQLRQAIISGALEPGQRLIERELITMLSVSRTVIREALRQLETEGLVDIVANKGPVVRALSAEEASDLYRIREVLEGLAGRLFVENASRSDLATLEEALAEVEAAYGRGSAEEILEVKNRFYDVLNSGARSETLSVMLNTLHARISRWRVLGLTHPRRSPTRSAESVDKLKAAVAAIVAGDGDGAEKAMREETADAAAEVARLLGGAGAART
jgi:DNA-binding GntR family transcriptional regulator